MNEYKEQSLPQIEKIKTPDNEIYEKANLIVQTTNKCNKNCSACYLSENPEIKKQELDQHKYKECILKLNEGDTVALRGGEMTTIKDWFEKFIVPALDKGLRIIVETNGYFIGTDDYENILKKINNNQISIRISFDSSHIENLKKENIASEFEKMARFAKDAENAGINFGFYSLGMNETQILTFIQGTPLEVYFNKFHSLDFYSQISDLKINGKYLKSNGNISDKIEV